MKMRWWYPARCLAALALLASVGVHANPVTTWDSRPADFAGWSPFGRSARFAGVDTALSRAVWRFRGLSSESRPQPPSGVSETPGDDCRAALHRKFLVGEQSTSRGEWHPQLVCIQLERRGGRS